MGGSGSGTWYRWDKQDTVEDYPKLDIHYLKRHGYLRNLSMGTITWSRMGEQSASISVAGGTDSVSLRYTYDPPGREPIHVNQLIQLARTPCNYGGTRPWFTCPTCARSVGVLVIAANLPRCRKCLDLPYYSQQCGTLDRLIHRKHKIEKKLDRSSLHEATREKIWEDLERVDDRIDQLMLARFGFSF